MSEMIDGNTNTGNPISYRKRQISMWDFAPEGAFRVFRRAKSGLSEAMCEFVFYEKDTGKLIMDDCHEALKRHLTEVEPTIW